MRRRLVQTVLEYVKSPAGQRRVRDLRARAETPVNRQRFGRLVRALRARRPR